MEKENKLKRRKHGCDGCRNDVPTEKFDGWCGNHLWLCNKCFKDLIKEKS